MRKIINSATTQYEPVLTEELVLDDRPISGSFNSITSDAVYKAISVDPGNVPPVESTDDGKVLTASYGEGGGSFEWATPSGGSDLPEYTTSDDGKVLSVAVDSSGETPVASLEWATPSGGGSSYTAGDGIDITANAVSADLDPKGLKITSGKIDINLATNSGLGYEQSVSSETLTVGGGTYYNGSIRLYNTSLSTYLDSASAADTFTLTIPGGVFGMGDIMPSYARVLFAFSSNPASAYPSSSYAYIDVTDQLSLVEVNDETQIGACSITLPAYMHASAGWSADVASHTYGFFTTDEGMLFNGSGNVTASYTGSPSGLKVSDPLPAHSSLDAGKFLQVQNDGTLAWVTLS